MAHLYGEPPSPSDLPGLLQTIQELGFTRRVVGTLARSARAHNTTLVVAYLHSYQDFMRRADDRLPVHLERFAREFNVSFYHAGQTLADPSGQAPMAGTRLPHDGHLTEKGYRLLAKETARFLRGLLPDLGR